MADYPVAVRERREARDIAVQDTQGGGADSAQAQNEMRLAQVRNWWDQARLAQTQVREEMAKDEAFVDHDQWDEEDRKALAALGQQALTFNLIANTVRWITGTEKKTRVDYKVAPRRKDGLKDAEQKTSLLKYLADVNRTAFHRSRAFADTVAAGLGWLEEGVRSDPDEEPLFVRYESWRNIWYDPLSVEPDMDDARYLFRSRWVDLDVASAMFPAQADDLRRVSTELPAYQTIDENGEMENPYLYQGLAYSTLVTQQGARPRVRLVECWYRTPERVKVLRGKGPWQGAILDERDPVLTWAVQTGLASTFDAVRMVMRCMIFADSPRDIGRGISCVLQDQLSPYWHNRFPFTPIWGYRRKKDNAPYGAVRGLRDPQVDLNKRRTKALRLLSTNQVIAEESAVSNWLETLQEVNREDGVIKLAGPNKKFEIRNQGVLAQSHIAIMEQDAQYIQQVGGVTDENMGRQTNAVSGEAIKARQSQGHTTTADLFDNLRFAVQISGEKQLALIEQFYDQEKEIRITGERGISQFVTLNGLDADSQITQHQADFVVDEQDYRATIRQAMFDNLLDITAKLPPEVGLKLMALAFDLSDLPLRDEFAAVLREVTGMPTPGKEPTPEEQAMQEAKAQADEKQRQLSDDEKRAKIRLVLAQAKNADATGTAKLVEALYSAIQTGQVIASVPGVAPIADEIAASAGFADRNAAPIFPAGRSMAPVTTVPAHNTNSSPMFPGRAGSPATGMMGGIETPAPDGMRA